MATVSFRVPDDVKARMEAVGLDRSESLRAVVEEALRREEMRRALAEAKAFRERIAERARRKGVKLPKMSEEVVKSRYEDH